MGKVRTCRKEENLFKVTKKSSCSDNVAYIFSVFFHVFSKTAFYSS